MSRHAHIDLPDGRQLAYEIRSSDKARSLRLKMTARDGLTVVAPKWTSDAQIIELVASKRDWIAARLSQFDDVKHLLGEGEAACPQAFDLPALAETWRVEYRKTKGATAGARTDRAGRVLVYGSIDDAGRSKAALRRWLARRAKDALRPWLAQLAQETGLSFDRLMIKSQRTRWGSCSASGAISLNCKLLFLDRDLVRYVLVHELCHTIEPNHGRSFWVRLRRLEPRTDALHGRMREAWKCIPGWAHRVRIADSEL